MRIFGLNITRNRPVKEELRSNCDNLGQNSVLAQILGVTPGLSGQTVSDKDILSVPPAYSAIRYISEGIAALPRMVEKSTKLGWIQNEAHPVATLFAGRPNPWYTWFDFIQALVAQACLGDGYARIHFDLTTMRPTALELFPRHMVWPYYTQDGDLRYRIQGVKDGQYILNEPAVSLDLASWEMIHVKGLTLTGMLGERISLRHKETFGAAVASSKYTSAFFGNGAHVGGVVTTPHQLTQDQRDKIKRKIGQSYGGVENTGSIMVLDAGMTFNKVQLSPQEAALIDFRNLSVQDCSRIFKVPLHLLSNLDRSTFSNMEQQGMDFVVHCLTPWVVKLQEEFNTKLFRRAEIENKRVRVRMDVKSMLLADHDSRAKYYQTMIQNGIFSINDARRAEGLNSVPGGDALFMQMNMTTVDKIINPEPAENTPDATDSEDSTDKPAPANGN